MAVEGEVAPAAEAGRGFKGLSVWPHVVRMSQARAWLDTSPRHSSPGMQLPPQTRQFLPGHSNKEPMQGGTISLDAT